MYFKRKTGFQVGMNFLPNWMECDRHGVSFSFDFQPNWMEYDNHGDSFPFDFVPVGILYLVQNKKETGSIILLLI